jgi:hypothetical protein
MLHIEFFGSISLKRRGWPSACLSTKPWLRMASQSSGSAPGKVQVSVIIGWNGPQAVCVSRELNWVPSLIVPIPVTVLNEPLWFSCCDVRVLSQGERSGSSSREESNVREFSKRKFC